MVPVTIIGRTMTVLSALLGLVLTSTLVSIFSDLLILSEEESTAVKYIRENSHLKLFKQSALKCVIETIRLYSMKNKSRAVYRANKIKLCKMSAAFKDYRLYENNAVKNMGRFRFRCQILW
jgi:hypothetical protein